MGVGFMVRVFVCFEGFRFRVKVVDLGFRVFEFFFRVCVGVFF
jgi:hypothetical protein